MDLFKIISHSEKVKNYIFLFLMVFFTSNILVTKADDNIYLINTRQEENELYKSSQNSIEYSKHDKLDNQLKMFFGFDPKNPETSFYPDSLIINYSDYVRDMYKSKLNEITIKNNL